jgi:hypothetical protein
MGGDGTDPSGAKQQTLYTYKHRVDRQLPYDLSAIAQDQVATYMLLVFAIEMRVLPLHDTLSHLPRAKNEIDKIHQLGKFSQLGNTRLFQLYDLLWN